MSDRVLPIHRPILLTGTLCMLVLLAASLAAGQSADALYRDAERQYEERSYLKAAELYADLADTHPGDARANEAAFKVGLCLFKLSEYDQAIKVLEEYVEGHKASFWAAKARRVLVLTYRSTYHEHRADEHSETLLREAIAYLEDHQEDEDAPNELILSLFELSNHVGMMGGNADEREKRLDERLKILRHVVDLNVTPGSAAKATVEIGSITYGPKEKQQEGLRVWRSVIEKWPNTPSAPQAQLAIARHFRGDQDYVRALAEYRTLVRRWPKSGEADTARDRISDIVDPYVDMTLNETALPGEPLPAAIATRNVKQLRFAAYKIDVAKPFLDLKRPEPEELIGNKPVKEWTYDVKGWRDYKWFRETIDLPVTEPGMYFIRVRDRDSKQMEEAPINVTSLVAVQTSSNSGNVVTWISRRTDGRAIEGVKLDYRYYTWSDEDKITKLDATTSDGDGLSVLEVPSKIDYAQLETLVRHGDEVTFIEDAYVSVDRDDVRELVGYVYTERPVYRPGQTVNFAAALRTYADGELANLPEKNAEITIHDPRGEKVTTQRLTTNEFGTLHGELELDEEPPLGMYSISVDMGDDSTSGRFRVEEYKKPEFEVAVEAGDPDYKPGEEATATVIADYYFGGPVPGATVSYTVEKRTYWNWWRHPRRWDWFCESYGDWGPPSYHGGGDVVAEGEGVTDEEGKLTVAFPTTEDDERDYEYVVSAHVTDQSRRTIDGSTTIKVSRQSFYLHPDTARHLYHADDKITVDVKALTPNEQPVETSGELMVYRVVPSEREVGEGENKRTEQYEDLRPIFDDPMTFTTDAEGLAHVAFMTDREGQFEAKVTAEDPKREKPTEATTRFWAVTDGFSGQNLDYTNLELITERDVYEKGETARVLVNAPVKDRDALVVVTARDLHEAQVVRLNGSAKVLEIEVTDAHIPEFIIQAWVVGEDRLYQRQKHIFVPPSEKFLNVAVTSDKEQYRPRDTGHFEVTALDKDGNPVDAEITLAITDESVYYIQSELADPIEKVFYARNLGWVDTRWWSSWRWERVYRGGARLARQASAGLALGADMEMAEESLAAMSPPAPMAKMAFDAGGMGADNGGGEMVEPTVRSAFADTCFWGPTLRTGDDGKATADVEFPDNLTAWRTTGRALTTDTKVGQAKGEVRTKKDVIARLQTPRFLVQTDEAVISTIAHNYLDIAKDIRVEFAAEGVELTNTDPETVRVDPGGEKRVDRRVKAVDVGTALLTTKALTDVESDAMQLPIPILVHGIEKFAWGAGQVSGEGSETFELPAERLRESDALTVTVTPSIAAALLEALPYLADYPYGCVEQTMSRFLPSVIVAETAQKLNLDTGDKLEDVPRKVKRGLRRLYSQQNSDGSWGWWSGGQGNLHMTSYVVSGLLRAKAADQKVDGDVVESGLEWIAQHVPKEKRLDTAAYAAYVLAQSGRRPKDTVTRVYKEREKLNEHTRALLALALDYLQDGRAATVLSNLEDYRTETERGCHWGENSWGWRWSDDQIEATAASLLAMLRIDPENPLIGKTVWWLVTNRRGDRWKSTKDTALAISALSEYMLASDELKPDYTVKLYVNDQLVKAVEVTPDNALTLDGKVEVDAGLLKDGKNVVRLEQDGNGALYYSVLATYFSTEAFIRGAKSVISVDRKYYAVEEYVEEVEDRDGETRNELKSRRTEIAGPIDSGTTVEVELTLTSENDFDYVMFEDPKPAGCEPVDLHSGYTWRGGLSAYREFRDEKVALFLDHLPQGEHKLTYRLRAEIPGDFHALPNAGQGMYMPDVRCLSDEFVMTIR